MHMRAFTGYAYTVYVQIYAHASYTHTRTARAKEESFKKEAMIPSENNIIITDNLLMF